MKKQTVVCGACHKKSDKKDWGKVVGLTGGCPHCHGEFYDLLSDVTYKELKERKLEHKKNWKRFN